MEEKKILLTGGSGRLGTELQKLVPCYAPPHSELDITDNLRCIEILRELSPEIIIHAAAYTNVKKAEEEKNKCFLTNALGTLYLVLAAKEVGVKRFVYLSTDAVFDGEKGDYKENDIPSPINFYSLTKLIGELVTRQELLNFLIIRTAFRKRGKWPHDTAYIDMWSSRGFLDEIAPQIIEASLLMDFIGVVHMGGKKMSNYDFAKQADPDSVIKPIKREDIKEVKLPRDISLDCSLWEKIKDSKKT